MPWRLALRAERWRARIGRGLAARLGGNGTVYVHERVEEYRRYWEEGARLLGAELVPLTAAIWEIRKGDRRIRIANHATPCDDPATRQLAGDAFEWDAVPPMAVKGKAEPVETFIPRRKAGTDLMQSSG